MNKQQFLASRQQSWNTFAALLRKFEGSRNRATVAQITRFSRLLRELSGDLATLRSREFGDDVVDYVNDLVARGHNTFYNRPPSQWRVAWDFLAYDFPRTVRQEFGYFAVAMALFFGPMAILWTLVQLHPPRAERVIPAQQLEMYETMYESEAAAEKVMEAAAEVDGDTWDEFAEDERGMQAMMAGFYVQHNVGIALDCFARGFLLGLGTVYTLLFNGIVIGSVAGYVVGMGHGEQFLSFVVSHGSFELTAIAIAGAGGLVIGDSLLHPGRSRLSDSLLRRGHVAVKLAGGAAVMLVVAAMIEGFWSPSAIPANIKYVVGTILWLMVAIYLAFAGRDR